MTPEDKKVVDAVIDGDHSYDNISDLLKIVDSLDKQADLFRDAYDMRYDAYIQLTEKLAIEKLLNKTAKDTVEALHKTNLELNELIKKEPPLDYQEEIDTLRNEIKAAKKNYAALENASMQWERLYHESQKEFKILTSIAEKGVDALQGMIIQFNGEVPGKTHEQVFKEAISARNLLRGYLYCGEESNEHKAAIAFGVKEVEAKNSTVRPASSYLNTKPEPVYKEAEKLGVGISDLETIAYQRGHFDTHKIQAVDGNVLIPKTDWYRILAENSKEFYVSHHIAGTKLFNITCLSNLDENGNFVREKYTKKEKL